MRTVKNWTEAKPDAADVVLGGMFSAISNLIGSGTGVNSGQLISDLLAASQQPKQQALLAKEQVNQSRISALASARSSLDTFAVALTDLLNGRAFAGDLTASEPSFVSLGFVEGTRPRGLPATLEISQLAAPQRLSSVPVADSNASLGEGTFTITTNEGSFDVDLAAGEDNLRDLAAGINASGSGVSASILTDNNGSRLVVEGAEGADEGFSLSGDYAEYTYPSGGGGMALVSASSDAFIKVDGIDLQYSSNQIEGAIEGVTINLLASSSETEITISGDQPTSSVRDLVTDFVDAYNQLRTALNGATAPGLSGGNGGPLAGDNGVRDMIRSLGSISSSALSDSGDYRTLSDIGVRTANDGTLSIDSARLDAALGADPDAISNLLDPLVVDEQNPGLDGIVQAIRDQLQSENGALEASQSRLDRIRTEIVDLREQLAEDGERYEAQLQRNFANMDRQLIVLQATQSYLTQQIAIWNGDNN